MTDAFQSWLAALEKRHLADLRPAEVTRAVRALSVDYVQRRHRVSTDAFEGRGKRAAFALFYGPLHFVAVRDVAQAVGVDHVGGGRIVDLGCGGGAAGAATALVMGTHPLVIGVDRQGWTLEEAAFTYRHFGLRHRTVRSDVRRYSLRSDSHTLLVAAYTLNELDSDSRAAVLASLQAALREGAGLLIVEPISRAITPWWGQWVAALDSYGAREDQWRFIERLPEPLRRWDRAAGLDHAERKARSLWRPPQARS